MLMHSRISQEEKVVNNFDNFHSFPVNIPLQQGFD